MITAMKKYYYSQAPLPFVGQKRMFASEFRKVLKHFSDRTVFVDLFGGSGLLSHITKREIRISGEGATLYVNGVPHDMTMMLETIRGAGARPERISPARWISLLRGRPTVLPGCESPLVMVRVPSGYTVRCLFPAGEKGHSFQAEMQ